MKNQMTWGLITVVAGLWLLGSATAMGAPTAIESPPEEQGLFRPTNVMAMAWSPDGHRLATAGYQEGCVRVWDGTGQKQIQQFSTSPGYAFRLRWTSKGLFLLSFHKEGSLLEITNVMSGQRLGRLQGLKDWTDY